MQINAKNFPGNIRKCKLIFKWLILGSVLNRETFSSPMYIQIYTQPFYSVLHTQTYLFHWLHSFITNGCILVLDQMLITALGIYLVNINQVYSFCYPARLILWKKYSIFWKIKSFSLHTWRKLSRTQFCAWKKYKKCWFQPISMTQIDTFPR